MLLFKQLDNLNWLIRPVAEALEGIQHDLKLIHEHRVLIVQLVWRHLLARRLLLLGQARLWVVHVRVTVLVLGGLVLAHRARVALDPLI